MKIASTFALEESLYVLGKGFNFNDLLSPSRRGIEIAGFK